MRLLLDTHVFLWWTMADPRLSQKALMAIRDPANQRFLSSISAVEIAIKVSIGKLRLNEPVDTFVHNGMQRSGVTELPLVNSHAYRLATLPLHHRDPFDRTLVAIALVEDLVIMTDDPAISKYPATVLW